MQPPSSSIVLNFWRADYAIRCSPHARAGGHPPQSSIELAFSRFRSERPCAASWPSPGRGGWGPLGFYEFLWSLSNQMASFRLKVLA